MIILSHTSYPLERKNTAQFSFCFSSRFSSNRIIQNYGKQKDKEESTSTDYRTISDLLSVRRKIAFTYLTYRASPQIMFNPQLRRYPRVRQTWIRKSTLTI